MTEIAKDPKFRAQYDTEPKPDPEFEALLAGHRPIRLAPVTEPITARYLPPLNPR